MKKLIVAILVVIMLTSTRLTNVGVAEEISHELVFSTDTSPTGDWSYGNVWSRNRTDTLIRELINDYNTVTYGHGGSIVVNQSVTDQIQTSINEDGTKTYTVTISQDLVFSDGSPITSADFLLSPLLFSHPTMYGLYPEMSGQFNQVMGYDEYASGSVKEFKGIRLLDRYTYSLTAKVWGGPNFFDLIYANLSPDSISMWLGEGYEVRDDGNGAYLSGDMSVGTVDPKVQNARYLTEGRVTAGPYRLVDYDAEAKAAKLEINPFYKGNFEGQKPRIKSITLLKEDSGLLMESLKSGKVNITDSIGSPYRTEEVQQLITSNKFKAISFAKGSYFDLQFQCDVGPTQFQSVRQALACLIDRTAFPKAFGDVDYTIVQGPYLPSMWMYIESEDVLNQRLDPYQYSVQRAIKLLEDDGWILNDKGDRWENGFRWKEVTVQQAGTYVHNIKLNDGRILMPLIIECASNNEVVLNQLQSQLTGNPDLAQTGLDFRTSLLDMGELFSWMYRDQRDGDKYAKPLYGLFSISVTGVSPNYKLTTDESRLHDSQLEKLSSDMYSGIDYTQKDNYLKMWVEYIDRWNEMLPALPVFSRHTYVVHTNELKGYLQSAFWNFNQAVLYAWMGSDDVQNTVTTQETEQPSVSEFEELKTGSRGQKVLDLKQRFYELGFYSTTKFNDSYSEKTADTVKLFEKRNGLKVDGIADVDMLRILFSDKAIGK